MNDIQIEINVNLSHHNYIKEPTKLLRIASYLIKIYRSMNKKEAIIKLKDKN